MSTAKRLLGVSGVMLALIPGVSQADHAWSAYHWERSSNPVSLTLGDNLTSNNWQQALSEASLDWNTPLGGYSQVIYTSVAPGAAKNSQCRPDTGHIEVCNDSYGFNSWLGIAQIWVEGNHITKGAVKVNDSYFDSPLYPYDDNWKRFVLCQEVGHTFGLGHQDEDFNNPPLGSCMDYSNDISKNRSPNAHDFEMLAEIYSHLDATTNGGGTSPRGGGKGGSNKAEPDDLNDPRQWGRLMSSTHSGRTQVFEHEVARGKSLVTFVIWAR